MVEQPSTVDGLAVVILAAGSSSRLGAVKQLVMAGHKTLLQRQVDLAAELGFPVTVVTGAHRQAIMASHPRNADIICNPFWQQGMATSIHQALTEVAADAWLFMTVDQYRITEQHLMALQEAWQSNRDSIVASGYDDVLGVPAIIPKRFKQELLAINGDQGAGIVIRKASQKKPSQVISISNAQCAFDLDTPDDLQVFKQFFQLEGAQQCIE